MIKKTKMPFLRNEFCKHPEDFLMVTLFNIISHDSYLFKLKCIHEYIPTASWLNLEKNSTTHNPLLTLTRPIGLPPHAPVAQKIADQR